MTSLRTSPVDLRVTAAITSLAKKVLIRARRAEPSAPWFVYARQVNLLLWIHMKEKACTCTFLLSIRWPRCNMGACLFIQCCNLVGVKWVKHIHQEYIQMVYRVKKCSKWCLNKNVTCGKNTLGKTGAFKTIVCIPCNTSWVSSQAWYCHQGHILSTFLVDGRKSLKCNEIKLRLR